MQGPSRQTLAKLRLSLDAAIQQSGDAAVLASELFAIADLLAKEGTLRRSMADPARPGSDRAGLLEGLLEGKVSPTAATLAGAVVAGRWTKPSDLVVAFEELGQEVLLASAESAGVLEEVEDELFRFARLVERESTLALALSDPALPKEQKTLLLSSLLDGKAKPETVALIERTVNGRRSVPVDRALIALTEAAAKRRHRRIATVTAATELSPEQVQRLSEALSRAYGAKMQVQVEVDPEVVGGVVVHLGDELIDGSVARRLEEAARAIAR